MSFIKAGKDRRAAEAADLTADIAMKEVEKALTKNEMAALSIQTEAYERESDALKTAAKTEMDSVREGDQRGVLAGSSRVQAGVTEAAGGQRTAMGQELMDLERLKADEETRKNDIGIQLKLGEVAGAQQGRVLQALQCRVQTWQQQAPTENLVKQKSLEENKTNISGNREEVLI